MKIFKAKRENTKQAIGIQVTFLWEINLKKYILLAKNDHLFSHQCVLFQPLLGWESGYVCHILRTETEGFYGK